MIIQWTTAPDTGGAQGPDSLGFGFAPNFGAGGISSTAGPGNVSMGGGLIGHGFLAPAQKGPVAYSRDYVPNRG